MSHLILWCSQPNRHDVAGDDEICHCQIDDEHIDSNAQSLGQTYSSNDEDIANTPHHSHNTEDDEYDEVHYCLRLEDKGSWYGLFYSLTNLWPQLLLMNDHS